MKIYPTRTLSRFVYATLCAFAVLSSVSQPARADTYPSRLIKIIVPTSPGGNLDLTARLLAKYMQAPLGQTLVVENHTGGDGIIAMHDIQRAAPDGYTVGIVSGGPLLAQPVMRGDAGYTYKDFTPIGMVSITPLVFVVPAKSPFKTMNDFVTYAKKHPGELSFGSAGVGGSNHIGFEMFKQAAGINVVHIPYRGSTPVIQDLIGGHIAMSLEQITGVIGQIQSGTLRPLAVSIPERVAALPSVPTVQELGYKGYNESTWMGLGAPLGLPDPVLRKLEDALGQAQKNPDFIKQLGVMGASTTDSMGPVFGQFLHAQSDEFDAAARRLGLRYKE
jgi:tripartite-type tricarboxylate transporter receptor subunit TctC